MVVDTHLHTYLVSLLFALLIILHFFLKSLEALHFLGSNRLFNQLTETVFILWRYVCGCPRQ